MDALEPIYQRAKKAKQAEQVLQKSQRLQSRPTAAYAKLNKVDPAVQRVETTAGMSASMHQASAEERGAEGPQGRTRHWSLNANVFEFWLSCLLLLDKQAAG
jgi:hypothetical protein